MYLGLHFGHDASASLFDETGLLGTVIQERLTGVRHDFGLRVSTIDSLLSNFEIEIRDIKHVGITSTQLMPFLIQSPSDIKLNYQHLNNRSPEWTRAHGHSWLQQELGLIVDEANQYQHIDRWDKYIKESLIRDRRQPAESLIEYQIFSVADPLWVKLDFARIERTLKDVILTSASNFQSNNVISVLSMCDELEIVIRGHALRAEYWSHHATHAASNLSMSLEDRIILTHDGGVGHQSGGVWSLNKSGLYLLSLHELELGHTYDYFADRLGLGKVGGAGKLMGLAAYGKGILFSGSPYFGTPTDVVNQFQLLNNVKVNKSDVKEFLFELCLNECREKGWDVSLIGDPMRVTEKAPVEIANFIQRFVERSFVTLAEGLRSFSGHNVIGVSGGFALNCPTNSKLIDYAGYENVIIDPHCEDGGCSVGAAFLSYLKNEGKFPIIDSSITSVSKYAYKGILKKPESDLKVDRALGANAKQIARLISLDKVIGIFYLNSEVGPRALGHRSIVANVTQKENWNRVNVIKGRESWRPFAPATLSTSLRNYFEGGPVESPFMLFNYKVKHEFREKLPAITHLDGTSRVQTVTPADEPFYSILVALENLKLDPVIMNTSLNGPGQPIVETETEAMEFFRNSNLDAILINDELIEK